MDTQKRLKITVPDILSMKRDHRPIIMLTAYDATFSRLLDANDVDMLLVGDSLGMVIQGHSNTIPVTLEQVIYHTQCVSRGATRALIVSDMPFMSYQASVEEGLRNAGRLIKEGGAEAVKLEGGRRHVELVRRLVEIGIPVLGHVGLTPQSVHTMGGYRIQGRNEKQARELLEDAIALEHAGAFAVVLEGIPKEVAQEITEAIQIPTIGIGAGPICDGQVLVIYDLLGMNADFSPRFVKHYEAFSNRIQEAVRVFIDEVKQGVFPGPSHSFSQKRELEPKDAKRNDPSEPESAISH